MPPITYPSIKRGDVIDDLHGNKISDPYRWLEDTDSDDTKEFVKAQQEITNEYFNSLQSRDKIKEKLTDYYNYEKVGCPFKKGDRYYFFRNSGLQNQSVLFYKTSLNGPESVFVDPNKWSEDGTTAIKSLAYSKDNSIVLFGISEKGSDWTTVQFKKVNSEDEFMEDKLQWIKFSSYAWTFDNKGVFYARFQKPKEIDSDEDKGTESSANLNQKIYYHVLGTSQDSDILIYENTKFPYRTHGVEITDDGKYLIITVNESCEPKNLVYYADISSFNAGENEISITELIGEFEDEYSYITNEDSLFYFQTNEEIITIDINNPKKENWKIFLPKEDGLVIESSYCVNENIIVVTFIQDVKNIINLYDLHSGKLLGDIKLPTIGTVSSLSGKKDQSELFYKFTSFTYPGTIFSFDFNSFTSKIFYETKVNNFNPDYFTVEQLFYESKDKTKIPMFIFYPKGLKKDGNTVTYLYGYGGFDISLMPSFSSMRCAFSEGYNAIVAIANLRGGGEYGPKWHKAGTKEKKQNVFDDFIAASEYLIQENYTCPSKLAIIGGSNGGLLVAACMNQRPELFGAVLCHVGVLDMLRFHKFTIGHHWTSDYGCADEEEDFKYIIKYSPYHNVRTDFKEYPSLLVCTADHDDRVVPLHSFKFIAQVQHSLGNKEYQNNPLLIRIESNAGHAAGKPTSKIIEEYADEYAFLGNELNAEWKS